MGLGITEKKVDGMENILVREGFYAITITGEIRIPGEHWCPEDDEIDHTEKRYRKIPEHLQGFEGSELRERLKSYIKEQKER